MHTIKLDIIDIKESQIKCEGLGLKLNVIQEFGPGGGNPYVSISGPYDGIVSYVKDHATDEEDFEFLMKSVE
jgi:hypothetical protein